jgi:hypothetical protein
LELDDIFEQVSGHIRQAGVLSYRAPATGYSKRGEWASDFPTLLCACNRTHTTACRPSFFRVRPAAMTCTWWEASPLPPLSLPTSVRRPGDCQMAGGVRRRW